MGKVPAFYVDPDLCTECGDCIKAMPTAFRAVEDEEVAEVYNADLDESLLPRFAEDNDGMSGPRHSLEEMRQP